MIQYLGGAEVAAEVKLIRAAFSGTVAIVEGLCDWKVFSKFFDSTKCYIVQSYGRDNLLEGLGKLNSESFQGVVAIADADTWRIYGGVPRIKNLCVTDDHDLEMMIIGSRALDEVLKEYGSQRKIKSFFTAKSPRSPRTWLLHQADYLGRLRFVAVRDGIPLKFEGMKFSRFVIRNTLELDKECCIKAVIANTRSKDVILDHLKGVVGKLSKSIPRSQLCCGHDVVEILSLALRRHWGTLSAVLADATNLESLLRLAYRRKDFERTNLYDDLRAWEVANPPYRLFEN